MEKKLTDKEAIFCKEFVVDFNGARAAREAGYSEKYAKETAYENLTKPHIVQRIAELSAERFEKLDMTIERVGKEIAAIAFANLRDVGSWDSQGNLTLKPDEEIPDWIHPAIETVERIVTDQGVRIKIKMKDSLKALEMLAKHTKFFEDLAPVENNTTVNTFLPGVSTDKLQRILDILDEDDE